MGWHRDWVDSMFRPDVLSKDPPRLGIDYVKASAPETTIAQLDGVSTLRLQQNLAVYGIAGVVWNCARALVGYLADHPSLLDIGRVLELGAGSGAVGLALAASGMIESLVLTDLEDVLPLIRENIELTSQQSDPVKRMICNDKLQTRALRWGESIDESEQQLRDQSIILCSDCLYEAVNYVTFLQTLLDLTAHPECGGGKQLIPVVLIAYKQRIPVKERAFFAIAAEHFDIAVYSPDDSDQHAELLRDDIYICKLQRKVGSNVSEASNNE